MTAMRALTTRGLNSPQKCILPPAWSPHTPMWPARRRAGSPRGRARSGSRSSAPRQTGRGRRSRTRYSSRTWPAARCTGSAVWSICPAALSASASGGRQRGARFTTQSLPVRTFHFECWMFLFEFVWNVSFFFSLIWSKFHECPLTGYVSLLLLHFPSLSPWSWSRHISPPLSAWLHHV